MKRSLVVVSVSLAAFAVALVAGGDRLVAQALERDVFVSVLDQQGKLVTTLGLDDFIIREDGVKREVLRARKASGSMDLVLLLDNSEASTSSIPDMRRALKPFVEAAAKMSEVAVVTVADRPTIRLNYTSSASELSRSVDSVFAMAGSGAYLLDGLIEVSRGIRKREADRVVIIAISSEAEEFSHISHQQVLDDLKASGASLNVVGLNMATPDTDEKRERAFALDMGTKQTGGRYDTLMTSMGLEKKLTEILFDLSNQYRVTYARPQMLIPPERLEVTVRPEGLTARGTPARTPPPKPVK